MSLIVSEFEAVCLHCRQTGIVCQVCGAFLLYDYSKEHVHDAETGELVSPCPMCSAVFGGENSRIGLILHMKEWHMKELQMDFDYGIQPAPTSPTESQKR